MTGTDPRNIRLIRELCRLPAETGYVEFKRNKAPPEEIGEYISAIANSCTLCGRQYGYVLWGIDDETHQIVGTTFDPNKVKVGNEELENWLLRRISPNINISFKLVQIDNKNVVILKIPRAAPSPVRFSGIEWVRVGSYKKKLSDFPEKERALWRALDHMPFEMGTAVGGIGDEGVLERVDYPSYFELLNIPLPEARQGILNALEADSLIKKAADGTWSITNLGGILLAKHMSDFPGLSRKAVRVVQYKGVDRISTLKEQGGNKGYASGFERLISYINGLIPSNEAIGDAFRTTTPMYPTLAVRELVANALIHQDLWISGVGPLVEIFSDRVEITNPGAPLVSPERFLDNPPRSRNEALAALMRRFGICEERGSGVDKVVASVELYQLPAPVFEVAGENTRVVLFSHRPLSKMDGDDRVRACYQHACLRYVQREYLTNMSLRKRFGIEEKNKASASRLINEAVKAGVIIPYDRGAAPKLMKYVPSWAKPSAAAGG